MPDKKATHSFYRYLCYTPLIIVLIAFLTTILSMMSAVKKGWGEAEKIAWREKQVIKRSYEKHVVSRVEKWKKSFDVEKYGVLSYSKDYPLYLAKTRSWDAKKPTLLVTGGVHGYETSGVLGAVRFLETKALEYSKHFNIVVAPCISPWGFETINRWNPKAVDPNRSFSPKKKPENCEEAELVMNAVLPLGEVLVHFDLHETTDTDNTEFRPAKAARDGTEVETGPIPDGFYTVGDDKKPVPEFQKAIIQSVKKVTHIALPDESGGICGDPLQQEGVVVCDAKIYQLCMSFTGAEYTTTTEVYPDSDKVTDEDCIVAQVAAVVGGLDYIIANKLK